jgi:1-acyl-sn-glycerol-3-phosphate acyltransferase
VIQFLRSLLFAAIFYPLTAIWVAAGVLLSPFGRRTMLAVVLSWVELHHLLTRHVLGIRARVEGEIPPGPHLIAVMHESLFESLVMVRLAKLPVIVM